MAKRKQSQPPRTLPQPFQQARDELYSHILRCGVLEAAPEHQREWFRDTMEYLAERYPTLTQRDLAELRTLGERYCQPVISRHSTLSVTE